VEEIVLWGETRAPEWWTIEASVDHYVSFLQRIPRIHTLMLCGVDLNMVLQAVKIAGDKEDASVPESLPNAGSTMGEQVVGSQKYFQQVRSFLTPSETPPRVLPTALSKWIVSVHRSHSCDIKIPSEVRILATLASRSGNGWRALC
jgi:hypothetical protein